MVKTEAHSVTNFKIKQRQSPKTRQKYRFKKKDFMPH
jgi:hypothetical protein